MRLFAVARKIGRLTITNLVRSILISRGVGIATGPSYCGGPVARVDFAARHFHRVVPLESNLMLLSVGSVQMK